MNNNPIGIFDSGVGGLSVLRKLHKILPQENFVYLADQSYMPYGLKTKEELLVRVDKIMNFFLKQNVKAVIIACNTATIFTIEEARKKFTFPIFGVVPVIKTVANASKTGVIAVFSTPTTAKSQYLDNLIKQYASNKTVIRVGESHLEDLIEEGDVDSKKVLSILKSELVPLLERKVDAIALGCTHYPFVKNQIQRIVGKDVLVADSGGAVARRVKQVLENENLLSTEKSCDIYFTTGDNKRFEKVAKKLLGVTIEAEKITLL